jgi:hypothetical protein
MSGIRRDTEKENKESSSLFSINWQLEIKIKHVCE